MDQTLKQVGELLLGAIPTAVLLLALYAFYEILVKKPLYRVLAERQARTEGAIMKARADVATAEAKTQEYEQRLREARIAIFKVQEERRQKAQEMRAEAVRQARARAEQQIREAKSVIEQDTAAARIALQGEAEKLASEIIRTILRPASTAPAIGGRL
jgi:F-type H+-transporting ATPase subunit b